MTQQAHVRKTHFLGTKLRALRKRNGLTLEELSARCIQLDSRTAPSVSYLSMIESGKRVPSEELLGLLSSVFQREPRWSLDGIPEVEAVTLDQLGCSARVSCVRRNGGPRIRRIGAGRASRTDKPH